MEDGVITMHGIYGTPDPINNEKEYDIFWKQIYEDMRKKCGALDVGSFGVRSLSFLHEMIEEE